MSATTKFTGLTGCQVAAIQQAITEVIPDSYGPGNIVVGKTVVTFPWSADRTHTILLEAKANLAQIHGSRQHPVASLHAVLRKAAKAAKAAMES